MTPIQLSLFPTRGFSLLTFDGLLEDWRTGGPYFVRARSSARRMLQSQPGWIRHYAKVVPVEVHEGDETPTFVIGGAP
jgi:hypothetical protein